MCRSGIPSSLRRERPAILRLPAATCQGLSWDALRVASPYAAPPRGLTRRHALLAGALAAGAALVPARLAWAARGPGPVRSATYARLVATLRRAPDGAYRGARSAAAAAREFARWYAAQDASVRAHADAVLDGLAAAPVLGSARFAEAAGPAAGADAALFAAALDLAALTCAPPPDEDEHPLAPAPW